MRPADLEVTVPGPPKGQGSMIVTGATRAGLRHPRATLDHRATVTQYLAQGWAGRPALAGPVAVEVVAWLPRPKGHFGTGRNSEALKPSAPAYPTGYPDGDKVARLVGDALVLAGVIVDDAQVTDWLVRKRYPDERGHPGATTIQVWEV